MTEPAPAPASKGRVGPGRVALVGNAALAAVMLWLFGGDLWLYVQVQSAPVAAVAEPPRLLVPLLGVLAVVGGLAALGRGLVRRAGADWRGYRLFPIAGVVLLFLDLGVLASVRPPLTPEERLAGATLAVAEVATGASDRAGVPTDVTLLSRGLERLGPVPLVVQGEPVPKWQLQLRTGCAGPAADPGEASPGTLIYCVAPGRGMAWVTVVALPWGERFGQKAVLTVQPDLIGVVDPSNAPVLEPEAPFEGGVFPTPLPETPDAGR